MTKKKSSRVLGLSDAFEVSIGQGFELKSQRIAVYVGYSDDAKVKKGDKRIINSLQECGYQVVFVRATDSDVRKLDWGAQDLSKSIASIVRGNYGYDFGSWALSLALFPEIKHAEYVLFLNDSILGPFGGLQRFLTTFETSRCDVWAATINNQFFPHLQSYFLGFKNKVLSHKSLNSFWEDIKVQESKDAVVQKYELGLSRLLFSEAYVIDAAFPSEIVVDYDMNPTLNGWERLMELGFPFIKKMVIQQPELAMDGQRAPAYIADKFQENVWDLLS